MRSLILVVLVASATALPPAGARATTTPLARCTSVPRDRTL